nr:MAG TPA: hypothetical protein [Caudoviricetes sp.]
MPQYISSVFVHFVKVTFVITLGLTVSFVNAIIKIQVAKSNTNPSPGGFRPCIKLLFISQIHNSTMC